LEGRLDGLKKRSFFQGLGTLYDKTQRLQIIMGFIAQNMGQSEEHARQVALLSKCDLLTAMVGEFPTLQGTMGRYYGQQQGSDPQVACALQEGYTYGRTNLELLKTQGALGAWLAIADGMDTLVGFFALGRMPSGSKDPMALRRACHGVIKAMVAQKVSLDLAALVSCVVKAYQGQGFLGDTQIDVLVPSMESFFQDRFTHLIKESGILSGAPEIKGLAGAIPLGGTLVDLWGQGEQLALLMEQAPEFLTAYRRLYVLVHQMADQKATKDWELLDTQWEKALVDLLTQPMTIARLFLWTPALHGFFDHVTIQQDALTASRLGLMRAMMDHCHALGPLSLLMG
jgi:glycyl-tRNA synthetase beta chain